mmetsp:Transcript_22329/g.29358  ORF Transcript_22329/g.29358 Transcript_22329/m.29358 type:complete len:172 (+) Transcript_22329:108-623(+)|eukprot:CAMPEP_0195272402 /NCGR_PEP_ID=MMETSP0706-20130129/15756_1 /TAXON_ID=33640 /ORGANISM="Asterionellopsis glacialis, Strain CCMP134" /LENGTH=171 /DNA_ID=CAMNT_0040328521 /DNA_START=40 /DNA_END=555 /DNA_ORIENTATION=+
MNRYVVLFLVASQRELAFGWVPRSFIPSVGRHSTTRTQQLFAIDGTTSKNTEEKFISGDSEVGVVDLTDEEDEALRAVALALSKKSAYGDSWFDKAEAWDQARKDFPILNNYSDADLRSAYIRQPAKLLDVILYTPIGPFFIINIIFYISGFTWCDTPFGPAAVCTPPPQF